MHHTSGGVCNDTKDTGEVEAKCVAWVLGGEEVHVGIDGLRMTGASLGIGTWGANNGIANLELEVALLKLWCMNGASTS